MVGLFAKSKLYQATLGWTWTGWLIQSLYNSATAKSRGGAVHANGWLVLHITHGSIVLSG